MQLSNSYVALNRIGITQFNWRNGVNTISTLPGSSHPRSDGSGMCPLINSSRRFVSAWDDRRPSTATHLITTISVSIALRRLPLCGQCCSAWNARFKLMLTNTFRWDADSSLIDATPSNRLTLPSPVKFIQVSSCYADVALSVDNGFIPENERIDQ